MIDQKDIQLTDNPNMVELERDDEIFASTYTGDIIGLTWPEVIEQLDPSDLKEMSWAQICYICALPLEEAQIDSYELFQLGSNNKTYTEGEWPAYHISDRHAWKLFENLPPRFSIQSNGYIVEFPGTEYGETKAKLGDPKKNLVRLFAELAIQNALTIRPDEVADVRSD